MKKQLLLLFFACLMFSLGEVKAQYIEYEPLPIVRPTAPVATPNPYSGSRSRPRPRSYSSQVLSDGWYKSTVQFNNTGTNYNATYSLNVRVEGDVVTVIDFGDGNLHSGANSSGYTWVGGSLRFSQNSNGEIVSASTTVNVVDKDIAPKVFTITIK